MHARRIIQMRDGHVISDKRIQEEKPITELVYLEDDLVGEILSKPRKATGETKFLDYIRQASFAMLSHKMRSILSILGILIGVAAVIAMLALGQGAKDAIEKQLTSLGSNLLMIRPGSAKSHGVALEAGAVTRFTFADVLAISKLTDQISKIYPLVTGRGQIVFGNKNWNTQVEGVGVDYAQMRAASPVEGRFFTEAEVKMREKVALIGLTVSKELFGDSNPVGSTIKINLLNFKVIGLLPEKGGSSWHD